MKFKLLLINVALFSILISQMLLANELEDKEELEKQNCEMAYSKLFSENEINIGVYFGYLNIDNQTYDERYKERLIETLMTNCENSSLKNLCGFTPLNILANKYFKEIIDPISGKTNKVIIELKHSSYSESTKTNEETLKGIYHQKLKTYETKKDFMNALETKDLVFYLGHAREGTGPDFGPPGLYKYLSKKNLHEIKSAFLSKAKKLKLLGLLGCLTAQFYGEHLSKRSDDVALLLTKMSMAHADQLSILKTSLDGLLGRTCQKDLTKRFKSSIMYYYTYPGDPLTFDEKLPVLNGFFTHHPDYSLIKKFIPESFDDEYIVQLPWRKEDLAKKPSEFLAQ